jgi:hypothetical protein
VEIFLDGVSKGAFSGTGNVSGAAYASITLPDTAEHTIRIEPSSGVYTQGWCAEFGYYGTSSSGCLIQANKDKLIEVNAHSDFSCYPSGYSGSGGTAGLDAYRRSQYRGCTKLRYVAPFTDEMSQGITTAGVNCLGGMLYGCSSLITLPSGFNIPQGITTVNLDFLDSMFYGCSSLTALPIGFSIPQGIATADSYFLYWMFYGCSSLKKGTATPADAFVLPMLLSSGVDCAYAMFSGTGSNFRAAPNPARTSGYSGTSGAQASATWYIAREG